MAELLDRYRLRRHADPVFVPDPLAEIDDPPAHHGVHRGDRRMLDHRRKRGAMPCVQEPPRPRRLAVDQPVRPFGVEAHHPVPDDL